MAGKERQRVNIGRARGLVAFQLAENVGAVELCLVIIRIEANRLFEKFQRAVGIAALGEDDCSGAQGFGIGRLQSQGMIEGGDRRAIAAEGAQDEAVIIIDRRIGQGRVFRPRRKRRRLLQSGEILQHAREPHDGVEEIRPQGARLREPRHRGGPGLRAPR